MAENNKHENKQETLNEEERKTELSMEELEQVTGGGTPISGDDAAGISKGYKLVFRK